MFDNIEQPPLDALSVIKKLKKSYLRQSRISRMITIEYEHLIYEHECKYFKDKLYNLIPISKIHEMDKDSANSLYENKIVKNNLGDYYNIITKSHSGYCPICGATGDTLDHVLPKNFFVQYTLTPINMVPMCSRCNRLKSDYYSNDPTKEIFHPYFDNYSKLPGLKVKHVIRDNFFVPIFSLDEEIAEPKLVHNFKYIFEMNKVLSGKSSQIIGIIYDSLRRNKGEPRHKEYCLRELRISKDDIFKPAWESLLLDLIIENFDDFYKTI